MMMETEILEKCNARKQKQHKILKMILDLILSLYDSMTLWLCCCRYSRHFDFEVLKH